MLSNNTFLETKIQRLLDDLIEKELGVHVQRMLEMSRCLYTGGNFKQIGWKNRSEIGDLYIIYDHTRQKQLNIHKRSTALERSVKYFTGGLKPVSRRQPHP